MKEVKKVAFVHEIFPSGGAERVTWILLLRCWNVVGMRFMS